jgi:iron complex outermembrane receptor protein
LPAFLTKTKAMKKLNYLFMTEEVYFKKWQRKNYSVFKSIGKVIRICALTFTYTLVMLTKPNYAQEDSLTVWKNLDMEEVVVSEQRSPEVYSRLSRIVNILNEEEIELMPANSIQEALSYHSGIDVKQRGPQGVQADLSIRGGTFNQNLILLNGIDITDPQTGHFALNLPINLADVKEIELLKGPGSRLFGPNAFKGAVNIITQPKDTNQLEFRLIGGENGLYETAFKTFLNHHSFKHFISLSRSASDGYAPNKDYRLSNVFYQGIMNVNSSEINWQAGYKNKAFGAESFYTPKYPHQFEENNLYFTSIAAKTGKKIQVCPTVYWRRHYDRFELFRESGNWYQREGAYFVKNEDDTAKYSEGIYQPWNYYSGHNYHKTDIYGSKIDFSINSVLGKTSFGLEYRSEKIWSNVLGASMKDTIYHNDHGYYDKSYKRNYLSSYWEHVFYLNKFTISSGLLGNWNNEYENPWNFYPGLDVSYKPNRDWTIYATYNQSLRLPTFTELFYEGPSNQGNTELIPEDITSYEAGFKISRRKFYGYASLFYSNADNLIAWVLQEKEDELVWKTENLTQVQNKGLELALDVHFENIILQKFQINYTFIDQDRETEALDSKYSLTYLKHKLGLGVFGKIGKHWFFNIQGTYRDRNGSFEYYNDQEDKFGPDKSYAPYWLVDGKIKWQRKRWSIFLQASNILNTNYYDLGNIEMPGRWIKLGVNKKVGLNF